MLVPQRWAGGFVDAAGDTGTAALALELVKVLGSALLSIKGRVAGTTEARRLEQLIQKAFDAVPAGGAEGQARKLALAFVLLLVKRNLLRYMARIIGALEQELDTRRGILRAHLECAREPGDEFIEQLEETLRLKTGAAGVRLSTKVVPDLLAGCRLRIGSETIDASLQERLKQLEAELATGPLQGFAT
ncbi:MAG: F0F1 ATP synthase subunit delta [Treponema sp.]|jgi:F0F1-type ATP synthase delta subunit|nr:F0F1 ATP synthase subunit delta [Treponema sp.]